MRIIALLVGCGSGGVQGDAAEGLVLNEVLAKNVAGSVDEAGEHDDWLELFNGGKKAVSLDGLALTDDPTSPAKFPLPAGDPLPPGGYLVVWCDGQPDQGDLHATFKLSSKGEDLVLSYLDGTDATTLDEVDYSDQTEDMSWARTPDGSVTWAAATPTPGATNGS